MHVRLSAAARRLGLKSLRTLDLVKLKANRQGLSDAEYAAARHVAMETAAAVAAERALLAALGGNCHSPIAVLTTAEGRELLMRAALFSPDGAERVEGEARFAPGDDNGPAKLAADLLDRAAPAITVHFRGQ